MSERIIFTVATGAAKYGEQAIGLARSLKLIGDRTRRVVMSDLDLPGFDAFDEVIRPPKAVSAYLLKLQALAATNADEVLFIDSDCLAFRRMDEIFEACCEAPFAVQGEWIRDGHWYGWVDQMLPRLGAEALPMFNGGMMFYRRHGAEPVIAEAEKIAANYADTGFEAFRGTVPDEPCVALALVRTGRGVLLPDTSDFMNTPVGLVGRFEMDVRRNRCQFLKHGRHGLRLIRPAILHAGKYVNNAIYWRQLDHLEWLDGYEKRHPFGYMSRGHKLRRSLERRVLRWRRRI